MNTKSTLATLSLLLVALVISLPATLASGGGDDNMDGFGFGKKVAGTYVDNGEIGGGPFTGLQTLGANGTHTSTNTNCCGLAGNLQSHGQGVWARTGSRQITLTAIIFIFGLDGTPALIGRPTLVMDFDEDFETAEGTITTDLFFAGDDPINDEPFLTVLGTDSWERLHVVGLDDEE